MKSNRWKQRITIYSFVFCLVSVIVIMVICPKESISKSERRRLAGKPVLTLENLKNKSFMEDTEKYLLDHFPFREGLRRIKAHMAYDVLRQKENNDIYVAKGHAAKLEYPLNEASIKRLAARMTALRQQYFPKQDVWYAIVPDKNYFLAAENGYPSIDYGRMTALLAQELDTDFRYIDIMQELTIDDYYHTDTHWRQERILGVAEHLAETVGVGSYIDFSFTTHEISDFYGVYYGQAALPMEPDTILYLTNEAVDAARVWSLEENMTGGKVILPEETGAVMKPVYRLDKLEDAMSLDKYDMFAGGASSLQVIKSPKAATDRRLILFRDSYTSSLAPLLIDVYKEITLIDLRYINSGQIGEYVDFADADILFLYNTLIINHAEMLK